MRGGRGHRSWGVLLTIASVACGYPSRDFITVDDDSLAGSGGSLSSGGAASGSSASAGSSAAAGGGASGSSGLGGSSGAASGGMAGGAGASGACAAMSAVRSCAWASSPDVARKLDVLAQTDVGSILVERVATTSSVRAFVSMSETQGVPGSMTVYSIPPSGSISSLVSPLAGEGALAVSRYDAGIGLLTARSVGMELEIDIIEIPDQPNEILTLDRVYRVTLSGFDGANRGILLRNGDGWVFTLAATVGATSTVVLGRSATAPDVTTTQIDGSSSAAPLGLVEDASSGASYVFTNDATGVNATRQYRVPAGATAMPSLLRSMGAPNAALTLGQVIATGEVSLVVIDSPTGPFRAGEIAVAGVETFALSDVAEASSSFDLSMLPNSDFRWHDAGDTARSVSFGSRFGDVTELAILATDGGGVREQAVLGQTNDVATLTGVVGAAVAYGTLGETDYVRAVWAEVASAEPPVLYSRDAVCGCP
jgi:hypothetical protein